MDNYETKFRFRLIFSTWMQRKSDKGVSLNIISFIA